MQSKKAQMILDAKLKKLYETIKDYKDPKTNRQVATIFMKLPSKMVSCISNNNDSSPIKERKLCSFVLSRFGHKILDIIQNLSPQPHFNSPLKTFFDSNQLTFFFISFRHFLFMYLLK